jgi:hypothetical protein
MFSLKLLMSLAPPAARPMVSDSGPYLPASCAPDDFESIAGLEPGLGAGAGGAGAVDGVLGCSIDGEGGAGARMAHAEISTITSNMGTKITKNFQRVNDCEFFISYSPFIRFLYKYTDEKKKYYIKYNEKI